MAAIEGLSRLLSKLSALEKKQASKTSVVVGFQTGYAIFVHEDLEAYHATGTAKYLEQPARELKPEFQRIVTEAMKKGATLEKALLLVGLRLQREAQILTPVDTGALRNSAFTKVESK